MLDIEPVTPTIGAHIHGIDFASPLTEAIYDEIYQALLDHLVIFIPGCAIEPQQHLEFAQHFGDLDEPHLLYPHVEGFPNIVKLEYGAERPPDTNSWHTDLTYKAQQPFASILIARELPPVGGDTMWSSNYAAYERLSEGMKRHLEDLQAIHDLGDFRNSFTDEGNGKSPVERLNEAVPRFGHQLRPLIGTHPVTGRKFLNFNESFVSQIVGLTTNDSMSLRTFLANHMNKPEDQLRWRWTVGDLAMWDNRVTMHYALADYLPHYRCMNRITLVSDRRTAG